MSVFQNPNFLISGNQEDRAALFAALALAKLEFGEIVKSREVLVESYGKKPYTYSYAPLEDIIAATEKPLARNGLVQMQCCSTLPDGSTEVRLILGHGGTGAYIEVAHVIPPIVTARDKDGNAYDRPIKIQELGSEITYRRRYLLGSLLGVSAEEDDDGNARAGNDATITPKTRQTPPQVPPAQQQRRPPAQAQQQPKQEPKREPPQKEPEPQPASTVKPASVPPPPVSQTEPAPPPEQEPPASEGETLSAEEYAAKLAARQKEIVAKMQRIGWNGAVCLEHLEHLFKEPRKFKQLSLVELDVFDHYIDTWEANQK